MKQIVIIDTNILIRYFRQDHPQLSLKAKEIFDQARKDETFVYLDEVVIAETIWVLTALYKTKKGLVIEKVSKLLYLPWVINPRKKLITKALNLYFNSAKLSYIDCWLFVLSQEKKMQLESFDRNLQKLQKQ